MSSSRNSGVPMILAVDNAVMFLSTLKRLLEKEPYDLHCEGSAGDALRFLESNRPDLILLDIEMPDMDGYELARVIKRKMQYVPILFITANNEQEYYDKAIEAGAVGLLIKPLRRKQLLEKLNEFIK